MLSRAVPRLRGALFEASRCESIVVGRPPWLAVPTKFEWITPGHGYPATTRNASNSSSTRWKTRQSQDHFARDAKLAGLKSRAAFKLLEINEKHRLFKRGDTVIDLGYAPGSWSQVAANKTQPGGRVVGIDIIPAQPPKGVSTIQGNFLSPEIRDEVRKYVQDYDRGRARTQRQFSGDEGRTESDLDEDGISLIDREKGVENEDAAYAAMEADRKEIEGLSQVEVDKLEGRVVNVVLSDMSDPWPLTASTWIKSVSNPYRRMMNTSGNAFRDHAGSMDLCNAALTFCYDTLIAGGHFLCKFYQGGEDHAFELRLKKLFEKVYRIKPDSSRKESRESYFVCLRRRAGVVREQVLEGG